MSAAQIQPLPEPPRGYLYYRTRGEILKAPELFAYQHMLLRAWDEMDLSGILTLNGIPTVYIRDEKKSVTAIVAAQTQAQFWNQGIATVLLLRDPQKIRIFSSMTAPIAPEKATDAEIEHRLVETIDLATQASWAERFYVQLGTGHYYNATEREAKFDPKQGVDTYLLNNLSGVRDKLVATGLEPRIAHAFLGRILFTCYLCDRGIIELKNYFKNCGWNQLHELLSKAENPSAALYDKLFPALKGDFNSSMFDDDLEAEKKLIRPEHLKLIEKFLYGDDLTKNQIQGSLGFWAYNFKFIPIETISAIYESFLEGEDGQGKHEAGAFYTPRFLAEMTLDIALGNERPLYAPGRRYIDPACGSGIFLVLLFNRLAAEWQAAQKHKPTAQAKAEALIQRLDTLCGVDKNATACRIACFSLYLAFLDQFDPPDVRTYKIHTGKRLPNLLHLKESKRTPEHAVVFEADFFDFAPKHQGEFFLVIGNPPWAKRGSNQIAQAFMEVSPQLLATSGQACLLLPSKVFLNQTDSFQSHWLSNITLEKVVQLADYRRILFKEALCPCCITLFSAGKPDEEKAEIEYITPKVSRVDLRDGVIQVSPQDRKWIPLRHVLAAAKQQSASLVWKTQLWGTPRDQKFLDYLFTFPKLEEQVDVLSELRKTKQSRSKPWVAGQGCKPRDKNAKERADRELKPLGTWTEKDYFLPARHLAGMLTPPTLLCRTLKEHFEIEEYLPDKLYSQPEEELFQPPLVLFNQGFSEAGFFDYPVRFQHSLQSIAGPEAPKEDLMFLAAFLRSKFARYFMFHTAANIATERDKAHLFEVLRLPFFLEESEMANSSATSAKAKIVTRVKKLKKETDESAVKLATRSKKAPDAFELESPDALSDKEKRAQWIRQQQDKTASVQAELDALIYEYFGLGEQEVALIEDNYEISDQSDTPASLHAASGIPTLTAINDSEGLKPYAEMLTKTLNSWATGSLFAVATGGADKELGLGLIELSQSKTSLPFQIRNISKPLATALKRLQQANEERIGRFNFQRAGLLFDGTRIFLIKPALRGEWTRTAALNDAAEIAAEIAAARRLAKKL